LENSGNTQAATVSTKKDMYKGFETLWILRGVTYRDNHTAKETTPTMGKMRSAGGSPREENGPGSLSTPHQGKLLHPEKEHVKTLSAKHRAYTMLMDLLLQEAW